VVDQRTKEIGQTVGCRKVICRQFNFVRFFCRAKKELHGNLAVAQTWSEFNALLDKNKVCAKDF